MDLSILFAGTAGSVPTARRGLPATAAARRWRPAAVRLRRGHAAAAPALDRPAGARRDLPHPLPPGPLARRDRDAQDVRPARARAAAYRLRAAGPEGAVRHLRRCSGGRRPAVAGRARAPRRGPFDGYLISPSRSSTGSTPTPRFRGGRAAGPSTCDARRLELTSGPDFGRLQRGETPAAYGRSMLLQPAPVAGSCSRATSRPRGRVFADQVDAPA